MEIKFSKIHVDIVDTFEKFQGSKVKPFGEFVAENYTFINESDYQKEIDARVKVHKNLLWINARKGFFAQLLSKLNIYGVSDPRYQTMCTNGFNIQYHPDFVLSQSDAAIRFVLCHEILHCVGDHMSRRGNRNPLIWNWACDYAINPILNVEVVSGSFEWPVNLDGSRMGLYEEKYEGMKAEDIYDLIIENEEEKKKAADSFKDDPGNGMHVIDADEDLETPNEKSIVQEVSQEEEVDQVPGDKTGGQPGGQPEDKPGGQPEDKPGDQGGQGSLIGKRVRITAGPNAGQIGTIKQVLPNGDIISG